MAFRGLRPWVMAFGVTLDVIRAALCHFPVIASFHDKETEDLYRDGKSKRFSAIAKVALRKLDMIDAATELLTPPGNRLEALQGKHQRPMADLLCLE